MFYNNSIFKFDINDPEVPSPSDDFTINTEFYRY
jgi:hypothetical protein